MLTIETGTGNPDADSFVTLEEVRSFATKRNATVSSDDATLEGHVRKAHDFLLRFEGRMQGFRSTAAQALPFPRTGVERYGDNAPYGQYVGVELYGRYLAANVIPPTLKNAVCQLVIESHARELLPTNDGRVITSEAVGPLSTSYAVNSAVPAYPQVMAFLEPLLGGSSGGVRIRRV